MKRNLFALVTIAFVAFTLVSCKEKLKKESGIVTSVEASYMGDTVKTMKLFNGEDTLVFNLKDAQYNNGMMLKDDSVDVHYIKGHGDTLRALLVYVKPAPAKVIDIDKDTTKVLKTR